jgi:hypothetical protein
VVQGTSSQDEAPADSELALSAAQEKAYPVQYRSDKGWTREVPMGPPCFDVRKGIPGDRFRLVIDLPNGKYIDESIHLLPVVRTIAITEFIRMLWERIWKLLFPTVTTITIPEDPLVGIGEEPSLRLDPANPLAVRSLGVTTHALPPDSVLSVLVKLGWEPIYSAARGRAPSGEIIPIYVCRASFNEINIRMESMPDGLIRKILKALPLDVGIWIQKTELGNMTNPSRFLPFYISGHPSCNPITITMSHRYSNYEPRPPMGPWTEWFGSEL